MIDVFGAVTTVYVLADLQQKLQNVHDIRRWHNDQKVQQLQREIAIALQYESTHLAAAFYDYIVLASAGETRHAKLNCQVFWRNLPQGGDRHEAQNAARNFTPESLLAAMLPLFRDQEWSRGGFGGRSWSRIVEAGLLYHKVPPLVFLDHVVDLSHNGGLFLDKNVIFDPHFPATAYTCFLTVKTEGTVWEWKWDKFHHGHLLLHKSILPLVQDAAHLLGLSTSFCKCCSDPRWDGERITWGITTFIPDVVDRGDNWNQDDEESEEQDHSALYQETQERSTAPS